MLFDFIYNDTTKLESGVSCTGLVALYPGRTLAWIPNGAGLARELGDAQRAFDFEMFSAVEDVFRRGQLWGANTPIDPYRLRNDSDWGVAWQLWRMWYEYTVCRAIVTGPMRRVVTGYITVEGVYGPREELLDILRRKYDCPDKDRNWCRFLQLVTSIGWQSGHAPWLGGEGYREDPCGRCQLAWLLYVGNAPRRDVVYTTELNRGWAPKAQSTANWFSSMDLYEALDAGGASPERPTGAKPYAVLRAYQLTMRKLPQAFRDKYFRGGFADHVLEFDLND
jgi:hypothetical protein